MRLEYQDPHDVRVECADSRGVEDSVGVAWIRTTSEVVRVGEGEVAQSFG